MRFCDSPSLATVELLKDLGARALESQNRKPDPGIPHRFLEGSLGGLRKVEYSEIRPNAHSLIDLTTQEVLLLKSKQWEYEHEWRMLVSLEDPNGLGLNSDGEPLLDTDGLTVFLLPIPTPCITGVIFGSRMSDADKNDFSNLLREDSRYSHVRMHQSILDEEVFMIHTTGVDS